MNGQNGARAASLLESSIELTCVVYVHCVLYIFLFLSTKAIWALVAPKVRKDGAIKDWTLNHPFPWSRFVVVSLISSAFWTVIPRVSQYMCSYNGLIIVHEPKMPHSATIRPDVASHSQL